MEVALTVKPHWAYSIFHLGKDIENRSWTLPEKYEGQRIWIHSSAKTTRKEYEEYLEFLDSRGVEIPFSEDIFFPHSAIVGSVEFSTPPLFSAGGKWCMDGYHWWKINNAVLLPYPISAKGQLRFWDCTDLVKEVA